MNHYPHTLHTLDSQEEQTTSSLAPHTQSLIAQLHDLGVPSLDDLNHIPRSLPEPETATTHSFFQDSATDGAYMQSPSPSFGEAMLFYNNQLSSNSFKESQHPEHYWDEPNSAGSPEDDLIELDSAQDEFDSQTQHLPYNFTRTTVPRRVLYSPSYIQFESLYPWGASAQPTDEDLISKANSESYLTLYQCGSLKVHVNNKQAWELQCPQGCWVKMNIRSHIPLTTKGQFSNLESHWGTKLCTKLSATQENMSASCFALATIFPAWPQSDSSAGNCSSPNMSLWVSPSTEVTFLTKR